MAFRIPQPQDPRVTLPAAPANPPTFTDLSNALDFKTEVVMSHGALAGVSSLCYWIPYLFIYTECLYSRE